MSVYCYNSIFWSQILQPSESACLNLASQTILIEMLNGIRAPRFQRSPRPFQLFRSRVNEEGLSSEAIICALVAFTFMRGQRIIEVNAVKRKKEVVMSEVKLSLVRKYNAKLTTNLHIGWFSEDAEWDLYSHVWTRVGFTSSLLGFCCVDNLPCPFFKTAL